MSLARARALTKRPGCAPRRPCARPQCERAEPARLAYDRPSPKLQAFLARHYGLRAFQPQNNNFVVFDRYFEVSGWRRRRGWRVVEGAVAAAA